MPDETRRPPPGEEAVDVLVVDDSDLMRASLLRALTRAGLSVGEVASPIGATRAILRKSARLVLIDYDMPSLRGDHLVRRLRENVYLRRTKLVLMSGHDREGLIQVAAQVGADEVVAKSDGLGAVVRIVERLLERNRYRETTG